MRCALALFGVFCYAVLLLCVNVCSLVCVVWWCLLLLVFDVVRWLVLFALRVVGQWLLYVVCVLVVVVNAWCVLFVQTILPVVRCSLFVICCCLLVSGAVTVRCLLAVVCCSLRCAVNCALFAVGAGCCVLAVGVVCCALVVTDCFVVVAVVCCMVVLAAALSGFAGVL